MTPEQIEGNRIIAAFEGGVYDGRKYWNFPDGGRFIDGPKYESQFKYHCSWSWLMPVCKKILEMYFDRREDILFGLTNCDIDITWKAVVIFIDFWNDDTKEKLIWKDKPVSEQQLKWRNSDNNKWYNTQTPSK